MLASEPLGLDELLVRRPKAAVGGQRSQTLVHFAVNLGDFGPVSDGIAALMETDLRSAHLFR